MSSDEPPRWFKKLLEPGVRKAIYWQGRYRLRHGFCPWCNSSPPEEGCEICYGSYSYGPKAGQVRRRYWRIKWDQLFGITHTKFKKGAYERR